MRAFVFLLILANLLFLAWTQGFLGSVANPDALRGQQQLQAERVKVVARDELPETWGKAEKNAKGAEKKAPEACVQFSELPVAEMSRLEKLLGEKFPAFTAARAMPPGGVRYWVFIPPLSSKPEADKKAGELRKFRVSEFYVVQDPGPTRFAISLGIFSSREGATERLEQLRKQGVRSAKVGEREVKTASGALEIRGPEAQMEALRLAVGEVLPKTPAAACPASSQVAP